MVCAWRIASHLRGFLFCFYSVVSIFTLSMDKLWKKFTQPLNQDKLWISAKHFT